MPCLRGLNENRVVVISTSLTKEKGGGGYEYFRDNFIDDNVLNVPHIFSLLDYYNNQAIRAKKIITLYRNYRVIRFENLVIM